MIADRVTECVQGLDQRGFCVGNVAPDCNVENEDWTAFIPSREETHWMNSDRKVAADCERFWMQCVEGREFHTNEERSFYLGYYSHLVTDACFQKFIRDECRVRDMLDRIKAHPDRAERMRGLPDDFDAVKRAFSKRERLRDVDAMEYAYLRDHPQSGYLTVLRKLRDFPDYMDNFPKGAIVRKMGVMAILPEPVEDPGFVFFTREEYHRFVDETCAVIIGRLNCCQAFQNDVHPKSDTGRKPSA